MYLPTNKPLTALRPAAPGPTIIPDPQPIDGTIDVGEATTGDIVFCARPSPLQDLFTRAGEPWRHVGMVIEIDGEPCVIEVSGPKFDVRPLPEVVKASTHAAIARLGFEGRPYAAKAANWCAEFAHREQVYAWDDVILAGFIAVTRRFSLPTDGPRLERMVEAAVSTMDARQAERLAAASDPADSADSANSTDSPRSESYSCSAFVVTAFFEAGLPIEFDLSMPRARDARPSLWELARAGQRPLRSAHGCRMSTGQGIDVVRSLMRGVLAAPAAPGSAQQSDAASRYAMRLRWASPGDIWRSPTIVQRFDVV